MLPNPNELRKLTEKAISDGEKEKEKRLLAEQLKQELIDQQNKKKAERILADVPELCRLAAIQGNNKATAMKVQRNECHKQSTGYILSGVAKIVYDELNKAELNPTLQYCWDDNDSWVEIFVNW